MTIAGTAFCYRQISINVVTKVKGDETARRKGKYWYIMKLSQVH